MKFSRILGVALVVLLTTAAANQAATPTPAAPAAPAAPTADPGAAPAGPAQVTAVPEAAPAPVVALVDAKPATAGDPKAGQAKAGVCAACHGVDGNASDALYPKLAGQHERYIARQLQLFKTGERQNAIMQPLAAALTNQDMRDLGAYFATQRASAGVADDTLITTGPNADRKFYQVGERIFRAGNAATGVPACMACHGPVGRGNPGPTWPSLGGQHAAYTAAQLKFFRDGGVWGSGTNANAVMSEVARKLSDEEIQALATYVQGLHPAAAVTAKAE
jgi:cytochrome c553